MPPTSFSIVARGLERSRAGQTVLAGVDVSVAPHARMGIVGPNGVGKTTLLQILAGVEHADGGAVVRMPPTTRVAYLGQEPDRSAHETVHELLARRTGVAQAERVLETAAAALGGGDHDADDAYAHALDDYLSVGGPDFDARTRAVAADLGLPERVLDARTSTLSGGEAARASLAAVLLSRCDVLLLDEPTNDLDFVGLERLERFIREVDAAVVVVSHDRAFLEHTVSSVLELDEHSRLATEYAGGWNAYLAARTTARRHAEEQYETYTGERARLEDRARRQRNWAAQGVRRVKQAGEPDKYIRHARVASSEQQASKAKATDRALERLEVVEKPWEAWTLRFDIATTARSGDEVAHLSGAVVSHGAFRLGPVDLDIGWGDRVAIVGRNGAGKTTLIRALLGQIPLDAGSGRIGPSVVVGEMDQARAAFAGHERLLDVFVAETGLLLSEARSLLAKFGLGTDHVIRPTATLSPGERTRAVLARFQTQGVNCLVLDEPTNHLDLPAIEQLEQALDVYTGTLLLVTHDRKLLEGVTITRTVTVDHGTVTER